MIHNLELIFKKLCLLRMKATKLLDGRSISSTSSLKEQLKSLKCKKCTTRAILWQSKKAILFESFEKN